MRAERSNNIDLRQVAKARRQFQGEGGHHFVEKKIEGEYGFEEGPMFRSEIKTDHTRFILQADEPSLLGGAGVNVSPLTYVLYGTMACFAGTLAIVSAEKGVSLSRLRVSGTLRYDVGPLLTGIESPIIRELLLEVEADKDLSEVIRVSRERCPALYAMVNQTPTTVTQVRGRPVRPKARPR